MTSRPRFSIRSTASILPGSLLALLLAAGCGPQGAALAPDAASTAAVSGVGQAAGLEVRGGTPSAAPQLGIYRRIWPHEDGRSWTYSYLSRIWPGSPAIFYPTPGEVPTLTLDQAASLLMNEPGGSDPSTSNGTYGLRFNGQVTTPPGVTAQYLEASLVETAGGTAAPAVVQPGRGFLKLLRQARPDLVAKLAARGLAPAILSDASFLSPPTLLNGYAWEQNRDWIGAYGYLNLQVSWIYLTSGIKPGSEFSLQLVPDLADDVFLHARVMGWRTVETEAGVFHRALDVLYLVDFGLTAATDLDGDLLGYFRSYLAGTIDYAPGVGPVYSYERFWTLSASGVDALALDITLALTATGAGAAALAGR
jgi:hypothetical protein